MDQFHAVCSRYTYLLVILSPLKIISVTSGLEKLGRENVSNATFVWRVGGHVYFIE